MRSAILVGGLLVACGGSSSDSPDAAAIDGAGVAPTANAAREVVDTKLAIDVGAKTGTATIALGPSTDLGATLEVGDLTISSVTMGGADLAYAPSATEGRNGKEIDLALPASGETSTVTISYAYKAHGDFTGASDAGFTFLWPYFCSNLFPCHSEPSDGTTFSLDVTGVPAGKTAVFPTSVPGEAPSYQVAWAIDAYTELPLGTTSHGTTVSAWYRDGELNRVTTGTQHLKDAFDWLETTIGPYRFGSKVGTISVKWPAGAYGGMEHHPFWHVGSGQLGDELTNVHEAAHGWFGDGIRIGCWEDFVLSEGTVSYLEARALDVVAPDHSTVRWNNLASELAAVPGTDPVWPQSCGAVDVIADDLYTDAPYMRGAFFYRAVALKYGAELVDQALHDFYAAHAGKTGRMSEMIAQLSTTVGTDVSECADLWLKGTTTPSPGPCP